MKAFLRVAALSALTGLCALAVVPSASAGVGVSVDFGNVAIGYQDGYYDNHHHWHHWKHHDDYRGYRDAHPDNYRDYTHDRDEHHR